MATALLLAVAAGVLGARPALADDAQDARQLVDKARLTFESFAADPIMGEAMRALVKRSKGVLIYPQVLRGAFFVGASGGTGVFLARDQKSDEWSGPAFYTIGEASFGLQFGGRASEIVLVALTERGVNALLSTSAKLGADAGVALGPVGLGAEAATANLSADIISYSRSKGLYGGISVEGAVVVPRGGLNTAYYGQTVTPSEILIDRTVQNPQAGELLEAVTKVASVNPSVARTN
jgi:lipid-binding SYLF domain-containing protein